MQPNIVRGLFKYDANPKISNKPNTLTNDILGLNDKSLPKFMSAAITIIMPITAFLFPKTTVYKNMNPTMSENIIILDFKARFIFSPLL